MFQSKWTEEAEAQYNAIKAKAAMRKAARKVKGKNKSTKAEGLFKQVAKTVRLLLANPKHPGLHTHEYSSIEHPYDSNEKVFEAYVQSRMPGAYGVFWCYGPQRRQITIIAITPHP